MLEGFFVLVAPWAGLRLLFLEPGAVGGQVTVSSTHLVDPSCHEFSQTHEGVWGEAWRLAVVGRCEVLICPFFEEHGFGSCSERDRCIS